MKAENKFALETPCLIVDKDILEKNLQKMQSLADKKGKKLRPHAKTHKCTTLAKKQIEYGATGICAAKISEAKILAKAGVKGILLTGPFASAGKTNKILEQCGRLFCGACYHGKPGYTEDFYSKGKKEQALLFIRLETQDVNGSVLSAKSISLKSYGNFSALIRDKKWKNI